MSTGKPSPKGKKKRRYDWRHARKLYEEDGLSYTEIAEQFGCQRDTVARHAENEHWKSLKDLEKETAEARARKLASQFVDRDTAIIRDNLAKKHDAASRILDLALGHIGRLEAGLQLIVSDGTNVTAEDPLMSLRRLALVVQNVEAVDRNLAGLKDDGWRSSEGGSEADRAAHAESVQAALDEVERLESGSG